MEINWKTASIITLTLVSICFALAYCHYKDCYEDEKASKCIKVSACVMVQAYMLMRYFC